MYKGIRFVVVMVLVLTIGVLSNGQGQEVKNPDTIITVTAFPITTLDPSWHYETSSGAVLFQIYETLIFYKGTSATEYVPKLATEVPSLENGLISEDGLTYKFPIRKGVKFQNGNELTPEDVEYTFERTMVMDRTGGPAWLLLEPLLNVSSLTDEEGNFVVTFDQIDRAVEVEGDYVVFRLATPFPPFLGIIASSWAGLIIDKEWTIEQGGWDGTEATWKDFHNPAKKEDTALFDVANGTGPFMLERWDPGKEIVLKRNDNYWRKPAKVERLVRKIVYEWTTRRLMLLEGDADTVYTPAMYIPQVEGVEGIKVVKGLELLFVTGIMFNQELNMKGNTLVGSGKLDGEGIPSDFFRDINVRKAFCYSFDWDTFIEDGLLGLGKPLASPIPPGVDHYNPDQKGYQYDPEKAKEHFKKAFDGELWEKGFKLVAIYNVGNEVRKLAAEILERNIEALNPKFHIDVLGVTWPTMLDMRLTKRLPILVSGWVADYPDPHNFVFPYMHTTGYYSMTLGISGYDELIDEGRRTIDPEKRKEIYYKLQELAYEDAVSLWYQVLGASIWRDWIKGWYFNPMFPSDVLGAYFYVMSKGYN
jgi:peptide/nickel transport system substrate-binding protein